MRREPTPNETFALLVRIATAPPNQPPPAKLSHTPYGICEREGIIIIFVAGAFFSGGDRLRAGLASVFVPLWNILGLFILAAVLLSLQRICRRCVRRRFGVRVRFVENAGKKVHKLVFCILYAYTPGTPSTIVASGSQLS